MGLAHPRLLFLFLLLQGIVIHHASATTFNVVNRALNTPGGRRFRDELGDQAMIGVLRKAQSYIEQALSLSVERNIDHLTLYVENMKEPIAYYSTDDQNIYISAVHIETDSPGDPEGATKYWTGVLYHEMTHRMQNRDGPTGVTEGIADYIRLKAGYMPHPRWIKGNNWDEGGSVTAYFFEWLESTENSQFVNLLNQKIGLYAWSDYFFVEITGKDVNTLWQEYQDAYPDN